MSENKTKECAIQLKDLMIGDWVIHENDFYKIRKLGIFAEDRDGNDFPAVGIGKEKGCTLLVGRDEILPIPLTEGIIENNNFEKWTWYKHSPNDTVTYSIGDGYHLLRSEDNSYWIVDNVRDDGDYGFEYNFICEVKFVHTLQHALNLFELETLDIKLIKDDEKEDDFWEQCSHCEFFEGYDMCLKKENFGAVTNESKAKCKRENLFKEKVWK